MSTAEILGRFGHHPDPVIDAEVEIDRITGNLTVAHTGLLRALDMNVVSPAGLAIKEQIRSALKVSEYNGPMGERVRP